MMPTKPKKKPAPAPAPQPEAPQDNTAAAPAETPEHPPVAFPDDHTDVFRRTFASASPIVINVGGAGSSKSYSMAQLMVFRLRAERGKKFLITRKTLPSLRITSYKLMIDMIKDASLYKPEDHNMSDRVYQYNDNWMHFTSIDDETKIRSTDFNYIWAEEANEFTYDDLMQLMLRLRAPSKDGMPNQLFLTYNPSDEFAAAKRFEERADAEVIRSSYKMNNFLPKQYIAELEKLREMDPVYWAVFGLGEYARPANAVYTNWEPVAEIPAQAKDEFFGLDFGYNAPTALVRCLLHEGVIYEEELLYDTKLTNADLIARLQQIMPNSLSPIYADSAEPDRIEEIYRAGFNIHPAEKSVLGGIDTVKRYPVRILASSVNLIREKKMYKWRQDKNGLALDEPVAFNDHLVDAERYAIHSYLRGRIRPLTIEDLRDVCIAESETKKITRWY